MPERKVENLLFKFSAHVDAQLYDKWEHYIFHWINVSGGQKAVDVVALENPTKQNHNPVAWLIEVKDYRILTVIPPIAKIANLSQTMEDKVRHTLAGLADAAANASVASEKNHAINATNAHVKRIVLHLEPYTGQGPGARLFTGTTIPNVLQKLKQLVMDIDPNPLVLSIATTAAAGVPWTVA